jgi:hypothetical protein
MTCNRKIGWIAVLALTLTHSLAPWSAAADPDEQEAPPKPVTRTYNLSYLIRPTRDYPYRSDVLPPTKLHHVDLVEPPVARAEAALFPGQEGRAADEGRSLVGIAPLVEAIKETIDPYSWAPSGNVGTIRSLGMVLIIRQTPENHKQIEELLEQLLREYGPARLVSVKAQWVLLEEGQLEKILRKSDGGPSVPQEVDPAAMKKIKMEVPYQGQTTCFGGQTVYVASGWGQTVVTELEPEVTENVAIMDPQVRMVHWGAILEFTPVLSPRDDSVLVDLHSIVSEPRETPPAADSNNKANVNVAGTPREGVDRLDFAIQDLRTTLKAPLNKPVLVGGMTTKGKGAGKTLYLILEISASK